MNKLFLTRNPDLFQGEKFLDTNKNYFEGWYFKNTKNNDSISFIPGINIDENGKKAFIQVITNYASYYINYNINEFKYSYSPFFIQIGNNTFSKEGIHIDIKDDTQNIYINGDIKYLNNKNIKTSLISPNIMGPFSYVPFMECNHAILSMKNTTQGVIDINNKKIDFNSGTGYIEKDWGCSFPKSYIWCQGNNFQNSNASFMISIADIPFKFLSFKGVICVLIVDDIEYKFTTYNNAKIIEYKVDEKDLSITLQKGKYKIKIESRNDNGNKLIAPVKGSMEREIIESISSSIKVTLKKDNNIIFSNYSTNCGMERVL